MNQIVALRVVYLANVVVAGWISITSMFYPQKALYSIFENTIAFSEVIRLVGCLWAAICVLSFIGIFFPMNMSLILVFQLLYKSLWLILVALPSSVQNQPFPKGMAVFFIIWVLFLPFVIPWKIIFS